MKRASDQPQYLIAKLVSEGVIEIFEVIEVCKDKGEWLAVCAGVFGGRVELLIKTFTIGDACEAVGQGIPPGTFQRFAEVVYLSG